MSNCSKRRRCYSRYESYKVMVWSWLSLTELESSWRSQLGARDNGERGAKLRWTFPAVPDLLIGIICITSSHLREKAASPSVWCQRKEEFAGWRLRDTTNKIKKNHVIEIPSEVLDGTVVHCCVTCGNPTCRQWSKVEASRSNDDCCLEAANTEVENSWAVCIHMYHEFLWYVYTAHIISEWYEDNRRTI